MINKLNVILEISNLFNTKIIGLKISKNELLVTYMLYNEAIKLSIDTITKRVFIYKAGCSYYSIFKNKDSLFKIITPHFKAINNINDLF